MKFHVSKIILIVNAKAYNALAYQITLAKINITAGAWKFYDNYLLPQRVKLWFMCSIACIRRNCILDIVPNYTSVKLWLMGSVSCIRRNCILNIVPNYTSIKL